MSASLRNKKVPFPSNIYRQQQTKMRQNGKKHRMKKAEKGWGVIRTEEAKCGKMEEGDRDEEGDESGDGGKGGEETVRERKMERECV